MPFHKRNEDSALRGDKLEVAENGNVLIEGNLRTKTSKWYYCKYMDAINLAKGASGATQVTPDANTLGGYQFNADDEYLYFNGIICDNWDEASDIEVTVCFEVNVNNIGGNVTDTVEFDLECLYKGVGDVVSKSQTPTGSIVIGQSPQYKRFAVTILINYDKVDNIVQIGDLFSMRLNFNTTLSEIGDVIINFVRINYKTKMPQPEI